jgi:hypothetical protein
MAKSHIIPDAFMRRAAPPPFMECDGISRSIKRPTGWYDPDILGKDGEACIAALDDAAAKCFIERGYTYRTRRNPDDIMMLRDNFIPNEIYEVENVDTATLRLFALSLLWRAAVSKLDAMKLVRVKQINLQDIAERILRGDPGSYLQFPVYFGVFCGAEELAKIAPFQPQDHPFVRFFLDGVVAYVCPRRTLLAAPRYGRLLVGKELDRFPMLCYASSGSNHARLSEAIHDEVVAREGHIFSGFQR